jgi:uncharacterized protein YfiM (DUF2279 family)
MKNLILLIFVIGISFNLYCQQKWINYSDTLNKQKRNFSTAFIGGTWSIGTISLYSIWYSNYPKTNFHYFDDANEWLQMDKAGHLYSTNKISAFATEFYKWSGVNSKKSTIIGTSIGLGFQTTLEIMDGYNKGWGFSWSDMAANSIGAISYASQNYFWNEEKIILKFSAHPTKYASLRPNVLGSNFSERLLKDYNGQTYWMSFSPSSFTNVKLPKWLCLSLGYSIDQKIVGDNNYYTDPISLKTYKAEREFLISLDIDFSKLDIENPVLKKIVKQFNYVKFPFPSLILTNGKITGKGLYF